MTLTKTELAALIGSRICHDLVSPVGAISGGLELLEMTGQTDGPEMQLIRESLDNALTKIKFFRVAFGAADDLKMISPREALTSLTDGGGKITYHYNVEEAVSRTALRSAFLAVNCLEHAFAMGGDITVAQVDGRWTINGSGRQMRLQRPLWEMLEQGVAKEVAPNEVQFALLTLHCADAGQGISVSISEDPARIEVVF